mmetsp:Transcript_47587/g.113248  ORF Transcript_47587/g.113248 Transcript_47587/m.113248 type:complete len:442 (-) Transcript_47587:98-1423(-)
MLRLVTALRLLLTAAQEVQAEGDDFGDSEKRLEERAQDARAEVVAKHVANRLKDHARMRDVHFAVIHVRSKVPPLRHEGQDVLGHVVGELRQPEKHKGDEDEKGPLLRLQRQVPVNMVIRLEQEHSPSGGVDDRQHRHGTAQEDLDGQAYEGLQQDARYLKHAFCGGDDATLRGLNPSGDLCQCAAHDQSDGHTHNATQQGSLYLDLSIHRGMKASSFVEKEQVHNSEDGGHDHHQHQGNVDQEGGAIVQEGHVEDAGDSCDQEDVEHEQLGPLDAVRRVHEEPLEAAGLLEAFHAPRNQVLGVFLFQVPLLKAFHIELHRGRVWERNGAARLVKANVRGLVGRGAHLHANRVCGVWLDVLWPCAKVGQTATGHAVVAQVSPAHPALVVEAAEELRGVPILNGLLNGKVETRQRDRQYRNPHWVCAVVVHMPRQGVHFRPA